MIYRNITITKRSITYEYKGLYLKKTIKGYATSIDKAKYVIDETINFIEEYQKDHESDYLYEGDFKKTVYSDFKDCF